MRLSTFTERYRKWCHRYGYNFQLDKPRMLWEKAKDLIAMLPMDKMTKSLVQTAVAQLNVLSKTVETLRTQMIALAEKLPEYPVVIAMNGVGATLASQLIAEIGDITRFPRRGSLTAFAGVDPGAKQSGTMQLRSNKIERPHFIIHQTEGVTILTTSLKPFDFRTMLYLNLLLMCVLIFSGRQEVLILSFVLSILVFATVGSAAQTAKFILGFLALLVLQYGAELLRGTDLPRGLILVPQLIAFIALRIYPFVVLGIALKKSTNIAEITTALSRLRLHRGIILSIVVMIRYLPAMKDDFRVIVDAMRLKGIPVSLGYVVRHPMKAIEYFVVPMLFRSEKITEEFSGAALVKGYEYSGTRTSYFDVRMGGKDWAMIFLAPLGFALCLTVV